MVHKVVVANWKMELSYQQALDEINHHHHVLEEIQHYAACSNIQVILCPSFEVLALINEKIRTFKPYIELGGQDCSSHERGPYTGQVSARSLAEIGVAYCIVGHSERRVYQQETSEEVFAKAQHLIKHDIIPIICIGETLEERKNNKTFDILAQQIDMCASIYHELCVYPSPAQQPAELLIAYEPVWAIGTGNIPDIKDLQETLIWLSQKLGTHIPLLYGGSLTETTLKTIIHISTIHGFIIGQASSNIQRLKNMLKLIVDS